MVYVVVFVAGAMAATSGLTIWYYAYVTQLTRERQLLKRNAERLRSEASALKQRYTDLERREGELRDALAAYEARKVGYDDVAKENNSLKQDLFNLSVQLKKMESDHRAMARRQEEIDRKANEFADRYLKENVSWIGAKLTTRNFASSKKRLLKVIDACRAIGFDLPEAREIELVEDLKRDYERALRDEFAREEQARIRAQIREEEKLAREIEREIQDAEREQAAVEAALETALQEAMDEHSAEVEHLRARLKEAEEKAQRARSRAEMTKSGHVYVLSNIGSFGEGIFKVGMTRRLEPMDRVKELGDASVPFPFDLHMMISSDDAPALENALHRELHRLRLNKVNLRKEFFRVDLDCIREIVESHHGQVDYVADPGALEYRESVGMTEQDYEFVEQAVESLMDEDDVSQG